MSETDSVPEDESRVFPDQPLGVGNDETSTDSEEDQAAEEIEARTESDAPPPGEDDEEELDSVYLTSNTYQEMHVHHHHHYHAPVYQGVTGDIIGTKAEVKDATIQSIGAPAPQDLNPMHHVIPEPHPGIRSRNQPALGLQEELGAVGCVPAQTCRPAIDPRQTSSTKHRDRVGLAPQDHGQRAVGGIPVGTEIPAETEQQTRDMQSHTARARDFELRRETQEETIPKSLQYSPTPSATVSSHPGGVRRRSSSVVSDTEARIERAPAPQHRDPTYTAMPGPHPSIQDGNQPALGLQEELGDVGGVPGILIENGVYFFPKQKLRNDFEVYKGEIRETNDVIDKNVAIKIIKATESDERENLREMKNMLKLNKHPNVVLYKRSGKVPQGVLATSHLYLAMDLCSENLADFLQAERSFDCRRHLIKQICNGLKHIHGENIAHRDLKASNVLMSSNGEAVISDFGLSKEIKSDASCYSVSSKNRGTFGYLAHEFSGKKPITFEEWEKADIFSFGILAVYILTNGSGNPFDESTQPETDENLLFKRQFNIWSKKEPNWKSVKKTRYPDTAIAIQLFSSMISQYPAERPATSEILHHPFFWNAEKKLRVLDYSLKLVQNADEASDIGIMALADMEKQLELRHLTNDSDSNSSATDRAVLNNTIAILQANVKAIGGRDWRKVMQKSILYNQVPTLDTDEYAYGNSLKELARFVRNRREHAEKLKDDNAKKIASNNNSYYEELVKTLPNFFAYWFQQLRQTFLRDANGRELWGVEKATL